MNKTLLCLLSGIFLALSSCQSEDPIKDDDRDNKGGNTTTYGAAVGFTYESSAAVLRTHYGNGGSLNWSKGDKVRIVSPVSIGAADAHQYAHYVISDNGGKSYGNFSYVADNLPSREIVWNNAAEQHFYAYYPAESIGADPRAKLGAITDIDAVSGSAVYHVPADQSLTATAAEDGSHPLAYTIAANLRVPTNETSPVQLKFHDFMNVLRIRVSNPNAKPVKGVKVSSVGAVQNLAGTVRVVPKEAEEANINPVEHEDLIMTIPAENYNNAALSPLSKEVSVIAAVSNAPDLSYDLYLLPQLYAMNTLQVTVLIGDDEDTSNDYTKFMSSEFAKGSLKQVCFNIPDPQSHVYDFEIEMVDIPGGTFELGGATDSYEAVSNHPIVKLSDFKIGKYEVTQKQWETVIMAGIDALLGGNSSARELLTAAGFSINDNNLQLNGIDTGITTTKLWPGTNPSLWYGGMGADNPAYNVNYEDITNVFIPILNTLTGKAYKLPSEAQWEYAARGGNYTNDFAGATGIVTVVQLNPDHVGLDYDETELKKIGWFQNSDYFDPPADGMINTQSVGLLDSNGYGLYDMSGNVEEWCRDYYNPEGYPETVPDDYVNDTYSDGRVCRGGCYYNVGYPYLTVSWRSYMTPSLSQNFIGFRLAM